jgi:hypothetical protein
MRRLIYVDRYFEYRDEENPHKIQYREGGTTPAMVGQP